MNQDLDFIHLPLKTVHGILTGRHVQAKFLIKQLLSFNTYTQPKNVRKYIFKLTVEQISKNSYFLPVLVLSVQISLAVFVSLWDQLAFLCLYFKFFCFSFSFLVFGSISGIYIGVIQIDLETCFSGSKSISALIEISRGRMRRFRKESPPSAGSYPNTN